MLRKFLLIFFFVVWFFLIYKLSDFWVYTLTVPPILVVNLSRDLSVRNRFITLFVFIWLIVYTYNTTRYFFLDPLYQKIFNREVSRLPVNKFLFPPAGPIMFYNVGDEFGHYRVLGIKNGRPYELSPYKVIKNRTLFYDNIHRGVLNSIGHRGNVLPFCRWMHRRFLEFDDFVIGVRQYPSLSKGRHFYQDVWLYRCGEFLLKEAPQQ